MKRVLAAFFLLAACVCAGPAWAGDLPEGFVYLRDVDPTIIQDMRYFTHHNFIGRPIDGYEANECILTRQAAEAVKKVQAELAASGLGLKVYDCYRPERAVRDFVQWGKKVERQDMKAENYPRVDKADFFRLGYVASKSSHSRGSTVDLAIVTEPAPRQQTYFIGMPLVDCAAPYKERFRDNSVDMGTGFDCMDELSHPANKAVGAIPHANRMLLQELMAKNGFAPYDKEWWHFTLKNEPFPNTSFDFPVSPKH